MILAVDVDYRYDKGRIAGLCFDLWRDESAEQIVTTIVQTVADYVPGAFYKRELPCILALLKEHELSVDTIIIDGYVYLDGVSEPGLGKHLYDALNGTTRIIGVAKTPFKNIGTEFELLRGNSSKPLYITAAGLSSDQAKDCIAFMAGSYRFPTLLKAVDTECRRWGTVRSKAKDNPY